MAASSSNSGNHHTLSIGSTPSASNVSPSRPASTGPSPIRPASTGPSPIRPASTGPSPLRPVSTVPLRPVSTGPSPASPLRPVSTGPSPLRPVSTGRPLRPASTILSPRVTQTAPQPLPQDPAPPAPLSSEQIIECIRKAARLIGEDPEHANLKFNTFSGAILTALTVLFIWAYDKANTRRLEKKDVPGEKHIAHFIQRALHALLFLYASGVVSAINLVLQSTFGAGNMRRSLVAYFCSWVLFVSTLAVPSVIATALLVGEPDSFSFLAPLWFYVVMFMLYSAKMMVKSYVKRD